MAGSIYKSREEAEILDVCEKSLRPLGFRPVDADVRLAGRSLVRIFIDRVEAHDRMPERERGEAVSVDDCAAVSRVLGQTFDELDIVKGPYDLEVSSPGMDRRLRLRTDFEASVGARLKLKLVSEGGKKGNKNVTGKLLRVEEDGIVMQVDQNEVPISFVQMMKAVRVWDFEQSGERANGSANFRR